MSGQQYSRLKQKWYDELKKVFDKNSDKIINAHCRENYLQIIRQYSELCAENGLEWQSKEDTEKFKDIIEESKDAKEVKEAKEALEKVKAAMINDKSMEEWLEQSLIFLSSQRKYQDLMADINQLAEMWDEKYNREINKQCLDFQVRHRFFFSDNLSEIISKTPYTSFFNSSEDPDDRVILIVIDNKISVDQNCEEILHEVGHYIGCRKRIPSDDQEVQKCRQTIGQQMIAFEWINSIYRYMCADILAARFENSYANLRRDITINIEKRKMMNNILFALCSDSYHNNILSIIQKGITDLRQQRINYLFSALYPEAEDKGFTLAEKVQYARENIPATADQPVSRRRRKELICLNRGYLISEIKFAIDSFISALEDENCKTNLKNIFENNSKDNNPKLTVKRYEDAVNKIITKIKEYQNDTTSDDKDKTKKRREAFHWVYIPERLLEEIAADIFLCKFGGVADHYLDSILRGYALQERHTEEFDEKLATQLIENDSYRHRLIAITAALNNEKPVKRPSKYILKVKNDFIAQAEILSSTKNAYGGLKDEDADYGNNQLLKIMQRMNCVENPAILASEYAKTILTDERYAQFINEQNNKEQSRLIQRLKSYNHR